MVLFDLYLFYIREGLSYLSKMKQLPNLKHAMHRLQLLQHHYAITNVMMPNWSSCCIDLLPNKTIWCIMEKVPEFFFFPPPGVKFKMNSYYKCKKMSYCHFHFKYCIIFKWFSQLFHSMFRCLALQHAAKF